MVSLFWGTRLRGNWDIDVPDVAKKLADAIELEALPTLRSIITIEDFVGFTQGAWIEDDKPYIDVARGEMEAAQSMCNFFNNLDGRFGIRQEECQRVVSELCPLIAANDRTELARLLHKYEAEAVKRLKVEKIWEPIPFPIELNRD